jgi:hypothetical protein
MFPVVILSAIIPALWLVLKFYLLAFIWPASTPAQTESIPPMRLNREYKIPVIKKPSRHRANVSAEKLEKVVYDPIKPVARNKRNHFGTFKWVCASERKNPSIKLPLRLIMKVANGKEPEFVGIRPEIQ